MRQARITGVLAGLLFAAAAGNPVLAVVDQAKDFDRDTGHTVRFTFATGGVLQKKIAEGETADLFLQTPSSRAKFKQVGLDYTE